MKRETRKFLEKLSELKAHEISFTNKERERFIGKFFDYFLKLDELEVRRIVSDPYWIRYKLYRIETKDKRYENPIEDQLFAYTIDFIVSTISARYPKMFSIFKSYSKGLMLYYTLDAVPGKELLRVANRAKKDRDHRVRMKALKILPPSRIKDMRNDSNSKIREAAFYKLKNIYPEIFIDSDDYHIRFQAMINASLDEFDWQEYLETFREKIDEYAWWHYSVKVAASILMRIPEDELLFYMDLAGRFDLIDNVFFDRMGSRYA